MKSKQNKVLLKNEIKKKTVLKLDDFKSWDNVYLYVDAIVTSGSSEEAIGSVFVLGNTKTSTDAHFLYICVYNNLGVIKCSKNTSAPEIKFTS